MDTLTSMNHTWYQLSPYGTFNHPLGKQMILPADAKRCIRQTLNWAFKFGLKKIPVYIGHPDDPYFQNQPEHMNSTVYGYVKQMHANNQGLWAQIAWTPTGCELIANRCYCYLSPRWQLSSTHAGGHFHPEKLLSVGLTQHPNLPVQPLLGAADFVRSSFRTQALHPPKAAPFMLAQKVQERMRATGESYPEAWHHIYREMPTVAH